MAAHPATAHGPHLVSKQHHEDYLEGQGDLVSRLVINLLTKSP